MALKYPIRFIISFCILFILTAFAILILPSDFKPFLVGMMWLVSFTDSIKLWKLKRE